jgi:hypothetical protein
MKVFMAGLSSACKQNFEHMTKGYFACRQNIHCRGVIESLAFDSRCLKERNDDKA